MRVKEPDCVSGVNHPPAEQGGGLPDFSLRPGESARILVYLLFCLALLAGLPTGAVAQDPPTVSLDASPEIVVEGGSVTLTATLSEAHTSDHYIHLKKVADGSTVGTDDYCEIPSIKILSGEMTGSADFHTRKDTDQNTEKIILAIRTESGDLPPGYVLGSPGRETITISDTGDMLEDDPEVTFASELREVGEEDGTYDLNISLFPVPECALMINYSSGGTATFGVDYRMDARFSVPPRGELAAIPVEIINDSEKNEEEETVRIILTAGTGYTVGTPNIHTLTITDDDTCRLPPPGDPPITFSLSLSPSTPVDEGGVVTITATLSACLPYPTTIPLQDTGGGSAETDDYGAVGSIHIPAGETTGSVEVQTNPDPGNNYETLVIAVREDQLQYDIETDTPNVTVFINDTTLPEVSFESSSSDAVEGSGTHSVDIILSPSPARFLMLRYRDDGTGTAASGTDYDEITDSGGIPVQATEMSEVESRETISVNITANDDEDGGPKTVVLALAEGNGYVLGSVKKHTLIITDNDPPQSSVTPEISISGGVSVTEGEAATFELTASDTPQNNINVNVEVIGSSFAASGRRTVTVGTDGTGTLEVRTDDDNEDESDDQVTAFVVTGNGYSPADGTSSLASVPVRDNDEPRPPTTQPVIQPPPVTRPPAPTQPVQPQTSPDRDALLEIYKATGGEDWENSDDWNTSASIDEWYGVTVDGDDRVTGLYLHDNGLRGDFPVSELGAMAELRELALWGNEDLTGAPDDKKTDRAALRVFYEDNGNSAINGWFPAGETDYFSYSDWEGVTAGDNGRVTELDFSATSGLTGDLSLGIMSLSALTSLDISGTMLCVAEANEEFVMWLKRDDLSFMADNDEYICEEDEVPGQRTQSGDGGCAVASDAERGMFQLVLVVFALAAAVSVAFSLRRR